MSSEERRAKNAERQRSWRARTPERANAIAAAGRQRNRAKVAASWKAYYEKNKAELYKKKKAYLGRNGEKLSQWKRADYERHRESYIARARKRWREKNGNAALTKQSVMGKTKRSCSRGTAITSTATARRFAHTYVFTRRAPEDAQFGQHLIDAVRNERQGIRKRGLYATDRRF